MARTNLYLSGVTPNSGGFYDPNNPSGGDVPSPTNTPQLTNPDWTLTEDFSGAKNTTIFNKDAYTTWGADDTTGVGGKVLVARYAPDGIQSNGDAWSEQELVIPVDAVQVIVKFKEFIPLSYTSVNARNHKSVGFWSGDYGIVNSNIAITSECWPVSGGASPSMYAGRDGTNFGHLMTDGDPLLWENGDGEWHEICAVVELASAVGVYGRYRIYKDGTKLIDSNPGNGMDDYIRYSPDITLTAQEVLDYANDGNFIDTIRLFGWCNHENDPSFSGTMEFLYKDLEVTANETFKAIVEPV